MLRQHFVTTVKNIVLYPFTDPVCRKKCVIVLLLTCFFLLIPATIHYVPYPIHPILQPTAPKPSVFDPFPFPDALKPQVEFWKKIFSEYTSKQVVIHDDWYVNVVYEVVDIESSGDATENEGWEAVKAVQEKYAKLLENLSEQWENPQKMTAEEQRVYDLFQNIPESPRFRKKDAKDRVHAQVGQADRFKDGIIRAGSYLEAMKQIVAEYHLPEKLVHLPLIESVFNPMAESYLGAVGMWQFLHGTGKQYNLTINALVDERKDPLKSTRAAAQVLAHNYDVVQSWPLAITAYNHGLQGVKNAVKQVGSADIADIIEQYDSPRFGFASRNFYVEFLAAIDVALRYTEYFGEIDIEEPVEIAQVTLSDYVTGKTLERYSPLTKSDIKRLNPALALSVFEPGNFLPKGYQLNIPLDQKDAFESGYASIPTSLKYRYLPVKAKHRVKKGQTLLALAKRYNTTVKAIAKLNNVKDPRKIRVGQILKIPGGYVSGTKGDDSEPRKSVSSVQSDTGHRVEKGQTLIAIARKYNTSVEAIARINNIRDPRQVRAGQLLKIPGEDVSGAQKEGSASQEQSSSTSIKMEHRVEKGQTLSTIAKKYNTSVEAIAQVNDIKNPRKIKVGQLLKIPEG
jgi:membrane-bound lytic murein transglycosylase D